MNRCILVFGMPRSGTTWVGKLFDSHPDTLYRHEPDSEQPLSLPLYPEKEAAQQYRQELENFVASLPRMRSGKVVGKRPLFPKRYQSAAAFGAYRLAVALAKVASHGRRNAPCLFRPTAAGYKRARLVWKSIESLGRLGVCLEALPDARAIHLMRRPCGCVASILRGAKSMRFEESNPGSDDMWRFKLLLAPASGKRYGLTLEKIRQLSMEERLAWSWVLTEEKVLAEVSGRDRVLTVRYEDVCADPLTATRCMFDFAGLDWHPQVETFVRSSTETAARATDTDYYSVFKLPQASANRWRSELAPDVIQRIMQIVQNSAPWRFYSGALQKWAAPSSATAL